MSAHTSPTFAMRSGIFRRVNVRGFTSPRSISSHVHGADTGAPHLARTVYAAANWRIAQAVPSACRRQRERPQKRSRVGDDRMMDDAVLFLDRDTLQPFRKPFETSLLAGRPRWRMKAMRQIEFMPRVL